MNNRPIKGICSRCSEWRNSTDKCERLHCVFPETYLEYKKQFGEFPEKYFCSLSGGINAGKTYFLLVLVNSLLNPDKDLKNLMRRWGVSEFDIVDPASLTFYEDLITLATNGDLGLTDPAVPLGFFNLIITTLDGKRVELVLFNPSGEKIEDELKARRIMTDSHELKGSAVLHFVDPRQDKKLNKFLKNPVDEAKCYNFKIADHMYKVLKHRAGGVKLLSTPFAICVSKFDLILDRVPGDIVEPPFVESRNCLSFFRDIDRASKSLANYLAEKSDTVDPDDFKNKFSSHKYFAIAPFGKDTDSKAYWKDKEPKGVHAPFFWILKELKILPGHAN